MTSILRAASTALQTALAAGDVIVGQADLYTLTLLSGPVYNWTSWDANLVVGGTTYYSGPPLETSSGLSPQFQRTPWNVPNTMEIPTLEVTMLAGPSSFASTVGLSRYVINGALDGGSFMLERLYMDSSYSTSNLGTVALFSGDVGAANMIGARIRIKVRGKNSRLSVNTPRNVYQPSCIHTFCDVGCTLSAASFTTTLSQSTTTPTTSTLYPNPVAWTLILTGGTLTMTSGANAGEIRGIVAYNVVSGNIQSITLSYPLSSPPAVGDSFTVFAGCDKTLATCNNTYANLLNFRGFPWIPPPATAAPDQ